MQGLHDIPLRGGGVLVILPEAVMLLAFAQVFFTIDIWHLK